MKVFYVEDDERMILNNLGFGGSGTKSLFGALLDNSDCKKIKKIINDADVDNIPVDTDAISEILNTSHQRLCIMTDFKSALAYICQMDQDERAQYGLFIFDRNLSNGNRYSLEEIQDIDGKFTSQDYEHCHQSNRDACREGDYLLRKIFYLLRADGVEVDEIKQMVYVLSAYPEKEIFDKMGSGGGPLRDLYEQKYLNRNNYVDKGDEKKREEL